ncbi:hypothetical protein CYME_CMQ396C [Cyanidioschyzon merolae strain 10D]|jgi:hypothetical protein|uniref:Uncharacterized protein n=1 Tax=Cyanidioschyzon merolae (strain NIES-3377 / 10D) TaxID=280699 RepID=M1V6J9_CYAM1|nr:hypothetical protein CYME_CMQ396C [Cyanidioschyzon merolae strain 10D]BAM82245.1 hypothetical protein CYME_CMQ396C [Cyanidioschyzon merolae strain 10D]|eukprot:XP_005538281.1 hypothetical protein CYME_CMQ396C [Cyanidioschyzon merolae strain 10D]
MVSFKTWLPWRRLEGAQLALCAYLFLKGAVVAFIFSWNVTGALYMLSGLTGFTPALLFLVPLGCREVWKLYAFCGFRYCDGPRRLILGWIMNTLLTTPLSTGLLLYTSQWARTAARRTLPAPVPQAPRGRAAVTAYGRRRARLEASLHRMLQVLLAWLVGVDVRTLVCSINFFTRDEEVRWIEQIGKRAVPESLIVPQGVGRTMGAAEIFLELSRSFYGLPLS